ncbi:hypothetical protein [Qipengyuania marisflavi]|uniref:Uncharacterized protein n=1 Tax=Qipengyuania marisflavi TaxID=2486356 RepID=A0A5S3P1K4_9SPHN|nr:hypothetical protein [Qipengyuania marisflavi]TMM46565.1 hypothetical protein FEV51_11015 [Qipengyuania marisflavi]
MFRRLDLDFSIYRDRVQIADRRTGNFVDQPADFPFSSAAELVAHQRHFEDTVVRAIRKIMEGAIALHRPIAHIVSTDGPLSDAERTRVKEALADTSFGDVIFEL